MWFIIGIIIFLITFYIHKHTYEYRKFNRTINDYEYYDKLPFPIWYLIIMIIFSLTPIINIIFFVIGAGIYLNNIIEEDIYFKPGNIIKRFTNFLNKEV